MRSSFTTFLYQTWPFGLALSRWLSFLLVIPGFGDVFLTPRIRFLLALSLTICLTPHLIETGVIKETIPVHFYGQEILIGLFLGLLVRLFLELASIVGSILSQQIAFSNVVSALMQTEQQDLMYGFIRLYLMVFIFATDLHWFFFKGLVQSYTFFPIGILVNTKEMTLTIVSWISQGFQFAIYISAPFLGCGLCYYLILGLMNRLVPQIPVFFVGRPLEIALGFFTLWLTFFSLTEAFQNQLFHMFEGFLS